MLKVWRLTSVVESANIILLAGRADDVGLLQKETSRELSACCLKLEEDGTQRCTLAMAQNLKAQTGDSASCRSGRTYRNACAQGIDQISSTERTHRAYAGRKTSPQTSE